MRIIGTLHDPREAQRFAAFLYQRGIIYQIEQEVNTDWADPRYGDRLFQIWIQDEDQTEEALAWFNRFQDNPNDPIFPSVGGPSAIGRSTAPIVSSSEEEDATQRGAVPWDQKAMGPATRILLLVCCVLFFLSQYLMPPVPEHAPAAVYTVLLRSSVEKSLLYDYPYAFEILDKIVRLYGVDKLQNPEELPYEGKYLLQQFYQTTYWKGFYEEVIKDAAAPSWDWSIQAPLFEKIRQGEMWRLVTPIFLHADIFHLFFNMLWLIVLGKQIEQRIGPWRYLFFIGIAAIFSDTMQYLMSGSNFLGFSGVLCAMLTFIWVRQQRAPWEGYQLQRATMLFMMVFILGMAAVQALSFVLDLTIGTSLSPGIANTAHLSGAAVGLLLGRLPFFGWSLKSEGGI